MLVKILEKEINLESDEDMLDVDPIKLEYYLIESDIEDMEDYYGTKAYGIEIVKRVNTEAIESGMVKNFSFSRENAIQMLDKLAYNTVTPVGLPFVLDDTLGM